MPYMLIMAVIGAPLIGTERGMKEIIKNKGENGVT